MADDPRIGAGPLGIRDFPAEQGAGVLVSPRGSLRGTQEFSWANTLPLGVTGPRLRIPPETFVLPSNVGTVFRFKFYEDGDPVGGYPSRQSAAYFDCTTKEVTTDNVRVTTHPVEEGAVISDHARKDPVALDIEGVLSNTPLWLSTAVASSSIAALSQPASRDRAQLAYQSFLGAKDRNALVDVITARRYYSNMIMTSVVMNRGTGISSHDIHLNIRLVEVRIASSRTVPIDLSVVDSGIRATSSVAIDGDMCGTQPDVDCGPDVQTMLHNGLEVMSMPGFAPEEVCGLTEEVYVLNGGEWITEARTTVVSTDSLVSSER